jgi:hypothetical protein
VLAAYAEGKSGPKVAEEFNTSHTAVYAHWRKSGKICRSISEYDYEENCNHDFFDIVDRPEKAYWLGMLLADGCVSTENEVILSLHVRDRDTVEAFKMALGSHAQITIQGQLKSIDGGQPFHSTTAAVRVRSRRLSAALARHGILPGKTRDPRMVEGIPPEFERDFWRGAIDGDGWICWGARGKSRQFIVGFTGGMPVVAAFQAFCRRHVPTHAMIHPNHSVFRFVVTDWFAFDVAQLLYGNAVTYLPRKYKRFQEAVQDLGTRIRRKRNWADSTTLCRQP